MPGRRRRTPSPILLLAALAAPALACRPAPEAASYVDEILGERAAKDRAFRTGPDSPIPLERRSTLLPLRYFPPAPEYRVPAVLRPTESSLTIEVPTSTGQRRAMHHVGVLGFTVKGQPLTLSAFVEVGSSEMDQLFVPFADRTNGTETYPGGRYLNLERTATGYYDLDFNHAYNPYCYYDERYDCPFPPPENRLPLPIRAGERLADDKPGR